MTLQWDMIKMSALINSDNHSYIKTEGIQIEL